MKRMREARRDARVKSTSKSPILPRVRPARRADAPAIGRVHAQSWQETYPGIVPDDVFARVSAERNAERWAGRLGDPAYTGGIFVATDGAGEIIGFAQGGPERDGVTGFTGELYALYLLRAAQGMGGGRALVRAVAAWLAPQGRTAMLLWVLAANTPARRFYERLGGQYLLTKQTVIGKPLDEVAYGWNDTAPLRNSS